MTGLLNHLLFFGNIDEKYFMGLINYELTNLQNLPKDEKI